MKIAVIGGFGYKYVNGQTIKAENLCELLSDQEVIKIDSSNWKKHPFALIKNIKNAFKTCESIIMLPAHRGVKVFSRILVHFKKRYAKKIYYDVIGGWLPDYLNKDQKLVKVLSHFDGIWVETDTMKQMINNIGLNNITTIPNFKNVKLISENIKNECDTFEVCTFSRVMYEKGIETAVNAILLLKKKNINIKLDIYGPIDEKYKDRFLKLLDGIDSNVIKYCGVADANKSVEIISKYYALLFPTFYQGEGFAGTLIDVMFSGIPAIVSDWKYNCDIIKDSYNGLVFKTKDEHDLSNKLEKLIFDKDLWKSIHKNSLIEAQKYTKSAVEKKIKQELCK